MLQVTPSGQALGATVTGIDLSQPLSEQEIKALRKAWLEHQVIALPGQSMTDEDLERVTQYFGVFGREPFFLPIDGSEHVVALTRRADEKAPVFAENWHCDWSFESDPPIGTCLYSLVIPPVGGNTGFTSQYLALERMPDELRSKLEGKVALHSAAGAYAPDGTYGNRAEEADRSMRIVYSDEAREVQTHPLIMVHPETGRETIYGCIGYITGFVDTDPEESIRLLRALYEWQTREEFQYTHQWQEGMFVIWDNRCVLHRAYGGYDGYARELHRTTVRNDPARQLRLF
ncbi:MAG: TauD/TfdA family dioxygenase [Pseudomonadales bacterium]|nr:TauD/TfdA family dioxygenase [Pseudomonadales bacterium]